MLSYLKKFIEAPNETESIDVSSIDSNTKLQIATCALFLEVANSDDEFSEEEREFISQLLQKEFHLNKGELEELYELSRKRVRDSVSLYEYTDVINSHYTKSEKYEVVKNLWELILVDGKLDAHEEHFVRIISKNLKLEHKEMIAAKMEAKQKLGKS